MALWTRQFWKTYWISWRRIHKDKRARSLALRVTFFLVYLAVYAAFLIGQVTSAAGGGIWNAVFYLVTFGSGLVAVLLIRRWHKKQDELLNYSITGQSRLHPQDASDASTEVRSYLQDRTLIIASLLARGGSEIYLHQNQLSPGSEVLTRQIQNGLLRERGLWSRLEQAEADLAAAADGRWTLDQQDRVVAWCEQLRLLRWVLRVDPELVPLQHFPALDYSLAHELLRQPEAVRNDRPMLRSWDVRGERDIAAAYMARTIAELKGRGLIVNGPQLEGWADELRAKSLGASSDYLAGSRTIGELPEPELKLIGSFAAARHLYCAYLAEQLNAIQPIPFSIWEKAALTNPSQ